MLHVMLHELPVTDLDLRSIKERSNLVYLIGEDKLSDGPRQRQTACVGPDCGVAKTFDDPTIDDYALEGVFDIRRQDRRPAFAHRQGTHGRVHAEWQEEHTTVPAEDYPACGARFCAAAEVVATIEIDGFEFPLRPAVFKSERGAYSTTHGSYQHSR